MTETIDGNYIVTVQVSTQCLAILGNDREQQIGNIGDMLTSHMESLTEEIDIDDNHSYLYVTEEQIVSIDSSFYVLSLAGASRDINAVIMPDSAYSDFIHALKTYVNAGDYSQSFSYNSWLSLDIPPGFVEEVNFYSGQQSVD